MAGSDDETYSIMFSSMKHPARRKILRMLSDKNMTFSEMLEELGVSSSHLTYHLENLGELVVKAENGHYKLSTFGEAAVTTMKIVEEAPAVPSKHHWSLPFKWKTILVLFIVATVLLAGMSSVQYAALSQLTKEHELLKLKYNQLLSWSSGTDEVTRFLEFVTQINVTAYQSTMLSNEVTPRADLANIIEENLKYTLKSAESQIDVAIRFRDNKFSRYLASFFEGAPIYSQPQPSSVLAAARNLIQRLRLYKETSYLKNMNDMLDAVKTMENMETTSGNIKLRITISGATTTIEWLYVENDIEFQAKSLTFIFENRHLMELTDNWFLFTIGSTTVSISSDQAIEIARNYLKTYSWTATDGTVVNDFVVQDEPLSCMLLPHVRGENSLALIPYWYVTLHLDKEYPDKVDAIAVGLWADTGKVAHVTKLTI